MDLESQLLKSSLLCGLIPGGKSAHRLQLFFVANNELGSSNHENDFQRALETSVDIKKYWENWPNKWSGEYRITQKGYERALTLFGQIKPIYSPRSKDDCNFSLEGYIEQTKVLIRTLGGESDIFLNGQLCKSAKEACRQLEKHLGIPILTIGGSAVRDLRNYAIDNKFEMHWES
ncbi:Uncharacterised protein [uncultured archaeon]|nr:Uncharacterised protein [uncultured archaeon]